MFSVAGVAKAQEKEGSQPIYESGGEPKEALDERIAPKALCWD